MCATSYTVGPQLYHSTLRGIIVMNGTYRLNIPPYFGKGKENAGNHPNSNRWIPRYRIHDVQIDSRVFRNKHENACSL